MVSGCKKSCLAIAVKVNIYLCIQTYIEYYSEASETNHHGSTRIVNETRIISNTKIAFPDPKELSNRASKHRRVAVARHMANKGIPTVFGLFVIVYFITGAIYYRS